MLPTARPPSGAEAIEGAGGVLMLHRQRLTCYESRSEDRLETASQCWLTCSNLCCIGRNRRGVRGQQEISGPRHRAWAGEPLGRAMYGDHPMGWSTAGTEDTVQHITRDDFRDWIAAWYGSPNVVVSVAGNTSHDTVVELVGRYFVDGSTVVAPPVASVNGEARCAPSGNPDDRAANVATAAPLAPQGHRYYARWC